MSGILNRFSILHKQSLDISRLREFFEFKEDYLFEKDEKAGYRCGHRRVGAGEHGHHVLVTGITRKFLKVS